MFKVIPLYQSRCVLVICLIVNLIMIPDKLISGPATDRLSVCLVENVSEEDKLSLVRWIFVAPAVHPGVRDLSDLPKNAETIADVEAAYH